MVKHKLTAENKIKAKLFGSRFSVNGKYFKIKGNPIPSDKWIQNNIPVE